MNLHGSARKNGLLRPSFSSRFFFVDVLCLLAKSREAQGVRPACWRFQRAPYAPRNRSQVRQFSRNETIQTDSDRTQFCTTPTSRARRPALIALILLLVLTFGASNHASIPSAEKLLPDTTVFMLTT